MDILQLGICCSARNAWFASILTARLAQNLGIDTLVVADETAPAAETWEQASACSAVLLLLDATTARAPVQREAWQSLLEHNSEPPVALVRMEACHYPKLLERNRFHIMADPLTAARWIERWLVHQLLPVAGASTFSLAGLTAQHANEWWTQCVDQPGVAMVPDLNAAQAFAHESAAHFDGICWLPCEDTPRDVLVAEIADRTARGRRLLFVLAGAEAEVAAGLQASRHSFLIVPPAAGVEAALTDDPMAAFLGACPHAGFHRSLLERMAGAEAQWEQLTTPLSADRNWVRPAARFQTTVAAQTLCSKTLEGIFAFRKRWSDLCRTLVSSCGTALRGAFSDELCLDLAMFLIDEGRTAEAVGWLRILVRQATDEESRSRAEHELSWLVDDGGAVRLRAVAAGDQLDLGFAGFERPYAQEPSEEDLLLEELAAYEAASRQRETARINQLHLPLAD